MSQMPQTHQMPPLARLPQPQTTLRSLTMCLAYIAYYTPPLLPGRRLPPAHLRRLAAWIAQPQPKLRTIRAHPILAAHLALLAGANLVSVSPDHLALAPTAPRWLHAPPADQLDALGVTLNCTAAWAQTAADLGLTDVLSPDMTRYLQQTLSHQRALTLPAAPAAVELQASPNRWQLCLPDALPTWLLFELLQLGEWQPDHALVVCTPRSLATAARRGRGQSHIRWLLETATGHPLSPERLAELAAWLRRSQAYQVQHVCLLSTAQPAQLQEILAQKRWRPFFQQQLSPRHVAIRPDLLPHLQGWLAKRDVALALPEPENPADAADAADAAPHWLGLRLLVALGDLIPLPYAPPFAQLETLEAQIPPLQRTALESLVQETITRLRHAIQGRDAFWPPERPVPPEWLARLRQAVNQERPLHICYQSLAERAPGWRRVQPLRLSQRGALHYLHAYCFRTESECVFRLDRITNIE